MTDAADLSTLPETETEAPSGPGAHGESRGGHHADTREEPIPAAFDIWPELLRRAGATHPDPDAPFHDPRQKLAPFMRASLVRRAEILRGSAGWQVSFVLDAACLPAGAPVAFGTPATMPLPTEADAWTAALTLARMLVANDRVFAPSAPALGFVLHGHAMVLDPALVAPFASDWSDLVAEMGDAGARELATDILEGACRSFDIADAGLPSQERLLTHPREARQLTLGIGLCLQAGIGSWPTLRRVLH